MSLHSWLQNLRSALAPRRDQRHLRRQGSLRAATHRLNVEVLEDRITPSLTFGGNYPLSEFNLGGAAPASSGSATADFNGDGWSDTATLNYSTGTVNLSLSNADGTSSDSGIVATGVYGVAAADFTSDGVPDLLVGRWNELHVLPAHGDGTFAAPIRSFAPTAVWLALADFNADGRLDVFAITQTMGSGTFGSVCLGGGDGNFDAQQGFGVSWDPYPSIATADLNGDARTDVAVVNYDYDSGEWMVSTFVNDGNWYVPPPPPPSVPSIAINDRTVTEGAAAATFNVTLSVASSQTITVAYATGDGDAIAGSDYLAASGTLTFAPGETGKTITVPVIGDRLAEPTETFVVNLSGATNASVGDGQGVGTIVDDEPRINISNVTKKEGKRNQSTLFTFTVTLSAAYDQAVTMSYSTVNGTATTGDSDYIARTGTLTFAPGETTKTITIEVKGDSKREVNEAFYVDLFGNSDNSLFTKNRGIGTIWNDD